MQVKIKEEKKKKKKKEREREKEKERKQTGNNESSIYIQYSRHAMTKKKEKKRGIIIYALDLITAIQTLRVLIWLVTIG